MRRPDFSPSARRDLRALFDYIAQDNPAAAKSLLAKLKETCLRIARFPNMGALREDLAPDLRSFPVGNYVVFYRNAEGRIEIVRVLHSARDHFRIVH